MDGSNFVFKLREVLDELEITRNKLAVESKVRPATIFDLYEGKTKRIELVTLGAIIKTLNEIAAEKGSEKTYRISDIIEFKYVDKGDR